MTKICMLALWIGTLPDTFELWKKSVLSNPTIDFYLISDQKALVDEKNLHFISTDLAELKKRFQMLLDCSITLEYPYKLCDYKPLWGQAFYEIIKSYDFWGHLDLDIILGDIRAFLTEEILEQYDKLLEAGWFTLYRNSRDMHGLYKRSMEKSNMAYPYKAAFRCKYACYFDEYMGMNILAWTYGYKVFRDQLVENVAQDFSWQSLNFCSYITKDSFVFEWKDGKLYRHLCDETGKLLGKPPKEYMLVHIQKRKMDITFSVEEFEEQQSMWIVPNRFQLERPQETLYTEEEKQQYAEKIRISDRQRSLRNMKNYGLWNYIPHFFRSRRIRKWIIKEKGFF